ncbi:unnamed protein product [Arabidopsis thaliana]|uniref:(thale cress) hypothetical protein n=1 Tax=Arabidopsis thaliana TaxID=3702 RepID=A0A7G2FE62_ARATH|nr:unnamed protein product [Arabidopsis thaliana]
MSKHNLVAQSKITLPTTRYGEEDCKILGSINNHSKFSYLKIIKEILSNSLFSRLKTTFLGPIIKAGLRKAGGNQKGPNGLGFSGQLVRFLVVRQLVSSREDGIWFCINNKPMRFSLTEFHLVTGLPCWIKEDEVPVDFECDWPLLPDKPPIKVDDYIAQLKLWLLGYVSELKEAYARLDDKSDRFPVCARYLSTVQPSYEQIMGKEEDLEVISFLGDSNEEEDDDVLMHLLKSDYVFSELDWKRGYALVEHQEDEEVEIGDGSDVDANVGETPM